VVIHMTFDPGRKWRKLAAGMRGTSICFIFGFMVVGCWIQALLFEIGVQKPGVRRFGVSVWLRNLLF